jgi:hypothetical protein
MLEEKGGKMESTLHMGDSLGEFWKWYKDRPT